MVFLALVGTVSNAQTNDFSNTVVVGVGTPMLDNGIGFHVGYNPSFSVHEYFAVEGQLSYFYTNLTGSFISGNTGTVQSVNLLTGGRLYFTSEDKNVRPYINLLIGGMYNREFMERIGGSNTTSEFGLGGSAGAYVNISRFVIGLSLDTPQNFILKVGYTF